MELNAQDIQTIMYMDRSQKRKFIGFFMLNSQERAL